MHRDSFWGTEWSIHPLPPTPQARWGPQHSARTPSGSIRCDPQVYSFIGVEVGSDGAGLPGSYL